MRSFTEQGESEKKIRLGDTISITPTTRKVLNIYASDPAIIRLGDFSVEVDFSRVGSKKIPLASLTEYLGPSEYTLEFVTIHNAKKIHLAHLVSPFEVLDYKVATGNGLRRIQFTVGNEIQAVRISAQNLLDGEVNDTEFMTDNCGGVLHEPVVPNVFVRLAICENNSCDILFSESSWPIGFWLVNLKIRANGRWGSLTNSMNQLYADGVLVSNDPNARKVDEVYWAFIKSHDPDELPEIFFRIHRALLYPYAEQCWKNLAWIENFWAKISGKILINNHDNDIWCRLLELSTDRYQDVLMEYQIPLHNLGSTLPKIFSLERTCYSLKGDLSNSLLGCFSFFPGISDLYGLFAENEVDTAALFGFSNVQRVISQQEKPSGFDWELYKTAMKQRDVHDRWRLLNDDQWVPAKGDMLGPMHYRYALARFLEIFQNNQSAESKYRGKTFYLVKQLGSFSLADFMENFCFGVVGKNIDLGLFDYDGHQPEWFDDEAAVEREYQLALIRTLSLFAQICRYEARKPGVLERFCLTIQEKYDISYKDFTKTLGFILYIGEDLFAFYLFLWELVFTADCDQP